MKVVIAPQGFKGSLSALQVARAIGRGVEKAIPDAENIIVPMADGGEGTIQAIVNAVGGEIVSVDVTDPTGSRITAGWALLSDGITAVIEMASASGLELVPEGRRDPLITSTYGTGELIIDALDNGCRKFIIGVGGSATNDGGAGMAQALGINLIDKRGESLAPGGAALIELEKIDTAGMDPRLAECDIILASDVTNPLCGPDGASFTYGPQKGATPEMTAELDRALEHYAAVIKGKLGIDVKNKPGAGAAGGLGAGMMAFINARMVPGIDIVIEATDLAGKMEGASLVFTGEGRIDAQTSYGKTAVGVARKAGQFGLPAIAIVGEIGSGYPAVYQEGIDAIFSIAPGPISYGRCVQMAERLISDVAERATRLFVSGWKQGYHESESDKSA
ncbi:MAG: glycerate kinase [Dehalococcoidales bacterium]